MDHRSVAISVTGRVHHCDVVSDTVFVAFVYVLTTKCYDNSC